MLLPAAVAVLQVASAAPAAERPRPPAGAAPPTVAVVRVAIPPVLDGRLDDPAWRGAAPITALIQRSPREGAPASESTQVRLAHDAEALYVGARLFDAEAEKIVARLGRRDAATGSDELRVLVDVDGDHQTALELIVNPAGVRKDVRRDGADSDWGWDPVWQARTTVDSLGWTVELRVPLSQLPVPRGAPAARTWGVRVVRWIERKGELAIYPAGSPFAQLGGIEGIAAPPRVDLAPFVVGRGRYGPTAALGNPRGAPGTDVGAGLDLRYPVSPRLTLDATLHPDFTHVEPDLALVNLTPFEPFLEERRPFFTSAADVFRFGGRVGGIVRIDDAPIFFHSRRIGRPPQGLAPAPGQFADAAANATILGAARVAGRGVGGWSIGVLDAVTAREWAGTDEVEPRTNYFVGRVQRALGEGATTLGAIGTAVTREHGANAYVGGVDVFHRWPGAGLTLGASLSGSHLRGDTLAIQGAQLAAGRYYQRPDARRFAYEPGRTSLSGVAGDLYFNKTTGAWRWGVAGSVVSPGFEVNDLGFQQRADRMAAVAKIQRRWTRPAAFQNALALVSFKGSWNGDRDPIERGVEAFAFGRLRNAWAVTLTAGYDAAVLDDRLTRGGPLAGRPAAWRVAGEVYTDDRARVRAYAYGLASGDAAGGWSRKIETLVTLRPGPALMVSLGPSYVVGREAAHYVTAIGDPTAGATFGARYVLAPLRHQTLDARARVNATLSPALGIEIMVQPLLFAGDFQDFGELRAPRSFSFDRYGRDNGSTITRTGTSYAVDPDGPGPAAPFTFADPDFRTSSVRAHAALRWEYRPGSVLTIAWTHGRLRTVEADGRFEPGRELSELFRSRPANVFVIKAGWWVP